MFKELIAKECRNPACALVGQMQDKGLPICPECASELTPLTRTNQRMVLMVGLLGFCLSGVTGLLGFGVLAKRLTPLDTIRWVLGQVRISEGFSSPSSDPILSGWLKIKSSRPGAKFNDDHLLCDTRDGLPWCRERDDIQKGDEVWFDLTPHVPNLYVFYRGSEKPIALFPRENETSATPNVTTLVPKTGTMEIAGPAGAESFLIVASKQPVEALANLAKKADTTAAELDAAVKPLVASPDNFVVIVEIPHT